MDGSRLLNVLDFNDFRRNFEAKTLPQFVFMSPNMLNDGHNTTLNYATDWAKKFLTPMLEPGAYRGRQRDFAHGAKPSLWEKVEPHGG